MLEGTMIIMIIIMIILIIIIIVYTYIYIYIYIYVGIYNNATCIFHKRATSAPEIKNLDFRGFDSSRFLILRGGIPRSIGNSP